MQKQLMSYRKEVFDKYLQEIASIKFTFREVEIIACILHNRGEKKIGELLSIHYRTVSAHVRNIMNKLGCNSKDGVIDAIEKSGTFYFRSFYFQLLLQNFFESKLKKIHHFINRTTKHCIVYHSDISTEKVALLKQLEEHLKLSNINILIQKLESKQDLVNDIKIDKVIYFVEEQIPTLSENKLDSILILSCKQSDISDFKNIDYIDFSENSNYCLSVLQLIAKIIDAVALAKIIEEFNNEYNALEASWQGTKIQSSTAFVPVTYINSKLKKYIFSICGVTVIFICIYIINNPKTLLFFQADSSDTKTEELITTLDNIIANSNKALSASVVQEGVFPGIHALVKQLEELITPSNKKLIEHYFNHPKNSIKLAQYMYSLYVTAVFYNHNDYSFNKAIEILHFIQDIIEDYLKNLSKVPLDFSALSKEEILSELKIAPGVPEVYTKIIYILGSAYMHLGEFDKATSYFKLSQYLGNELNILQGPLSDCNGLMKIKQHEAFTDVKNGHHAVAKEKLLKLIELHRHYKLTPEQFVSYSPFRKDRIIQLNQDPVNITDNTNNICKCYTKLVSITNNQKQKEEYINLILNQYIGNTDEPGIFSLIDKVNSRKKANIYNELGYNLLQLYDAKIHLKHLIIKLNQILKLEKTDDLDFIEQIFDLALVNSRNSEIEKVIGYKGLITVNQKRLDNSELSSERKSEMLKIIEDLTVKINFIKQKLNISGYIMGITPEELGNEF